MLKPMTTHKIISTKIILGLMGMLFGLCHLSAENTKQVAIKHQDGKLSVLIDGELFTEYVYKGIKKPILYPIIGPHGIEMTRNYPMKKEVKGEANDHLTILPYGSLTTM